MRDKTYSDNRATPGRYITLIPSHLWRKFQKMPGHRHFPWLTTGNWHASHPQSFAHQGWWKCDSHGIYWLVGRSLIGGASYLSFYKSLWSRLQVLWICLEVGISGVPYHEAGILVFGRDLVTPDPQLPQTGHVFQVLIYLRAFSNVLCTFKGRGFGEEVVIITTNYSSLTPSE